MEVILSISSAELSDDGIQGLTTNLCRTITKETDIEAKLAEGTCQKGARGDPITLGLIALTFLSSGTAVALLNILKSYLERDSSLTVDIQRNDGAKLAINAKNMKPEQIGETFNRAREFLGESI